jgi:hypothetical protein
MPNADLVSMFLPPSPPSKGDLPTKRSKASERQQAAVELCRDVHAGAARIRDQGPLYLPQSPGEKYQNYATRLKRSVFTNFFRRTVDGLAGFVFAKDPVLGDDVPERIRKHWENIDFAGTHGSVFSRDILSDALVAGHAGILVDYPRTDGKQSYAAELEDVRPYWVPVRKEDIISWRPVVEKGRTILEQVVLRECVTVPDGEYGEASKDRYRVFRRRWVAVEGEDAKPQVSFRLIEIDKDKKVVVVDEGIYTTQTEIPLVEVPTSGKCGLFDSIPPLLDTAYLNLHHYAADSDNAYALHMCSVPLLARIGVMQIDGNNVDELVAGPNSAVDLPKDGDLKYVTPSASGLDAASRALERVVSAIGTLGLAMLAPQKRAAETAEAKRLDAAASDSALAVTARGLQDALERALQFHANYLLEPDGGSISVNREFESSLMEPAVLNSLASLIKTGFPVRQALEMMQSGGRIADDADLNTLELEWTAGQAASKELDRLDAEQRAEDIITEAA